MTISSIYDYRYLKGSVEMLLDVCACVKISDISFTTFLIYVEDLLPCHEPLYNVVLSLICENILVGAHSNE